MCLVGHFVVPIKYKRRVLLLLMQSCIIQHCALSNCTLLFINLMFLVKGLLLQIMQYSVYFFRNDKTFGVWLYAYICKMMND